MVADEAATLVWLAQLAAIELHPSLALAASRAGRRRSSSISTRRAGDDRGVLPRRDAAARDARRSRAALLGQDLGLKGLQLYMPLNDPSVDVRQTKTFAKTVAELLAREEPELAVATQAKTARKGKVLIDWAQNDRAKTTVAVYSLRAREQPTVSTPVTWDEVAAVRRIRRRRAAAVHGVAGARARRRARRPVRPRAERQPEAARAES